jgi:hypothetical protein
VESIFERAMSIVHFVVRINGESVINVKKKPIGIFLFAGNAEKNNILSSHSNLLHDRYFE